MNNGKVAQIGAPLEVYRKPADAFVARFLGSPPMNLLRGQLVDGSERAVDSRTRLLPQRWENFRTAGIETRELLVGVRPEDIRARRTGAKPALRPAASSCVAQQR